MQRIVQPEILDSLHPNDPDAIASRRDLRLINKIMGNEKWIAKKLFSSLKPNDRILEIGAGSGDLGRFLQKKSSQKPLDYCGLDLAPRPADWPADWQWFQDDLTKFNRFGDFTILLANLILHHFENDDLAELGKKITHSNLRLIVACEPARFPLHRWQLHLLRPFKLNRVTLHDGQISIRAGFRTEELPKFLGLRKLDWQSETSCTFLGAMRMVARRNEKPAR
ncbi:MAG TPA: hypothetical protein VK041_01145 [Opitutales bacterium]|nr:hypothetical protein [Opitutales bacterium]